MLYPLKTPEGRIRGFKMGMANELREAARYFSDRRLKDNLKESENWEVCLNRESEVLSHQ